jgi:hypothetical protein
VLSMSADAVLLKDCGQLSDALGDFHAGEPPL